MTTYTQNGNSNDELFLSIQDLGDNPTSRVPVALCLDVSGSMAGDPIRELNQGVKDFYQALRQDVVAAHSAEVAVVAFAERAELIVNFQSLLRATPPTLEIGDRLGHSTNLGDGVELALNNLNLRKKEMEYAGVGRAWEKISHKCA